jgi:hypothetical protein
MVLSLLRKDNALRLEPGERAAMRGPNGTHLRVHKPAGNLCAIKALSNLEWTRRTEKKWISLP